MINYNEKVPSLTRPWQYTGRHVFGLGIIKSTTERCQHLMCNLLKCMLGNIQLSRAKFQSYIWLVAGVSLISVVLYCPDCLLASLLNVELHLQLSFILTLAPRKYFGNWTKQRDSTYITLIQFWDQVGTVRFNKISSNYRVNK